MYQFFWFVPGCFRNATGGRVGHTRLGPLESLVLPGVGLKVEGVGHSERVDDQGPRSRVHMVPFNLSATKLVRN